MAKRENLKTGPIVRLGPEHPFHVRAGVGILGSYLSDNNTTPVQYRHAYL